MAAQKFSRFGEQRKIGTDTAGYDEYVEGVEADETTSLETPLQQDNLGFKLIQKMGWNSGSGLGKFEQGRVDPVPFELKEDHMGLGRWTMELELAQDATEKRRQLEAEKELSEDLLEQYRERAEKEKKMVEMLTEMNKAFYCELCDRQYTKYSEYDNHINSYSHHHEQRLRDLKQYETGRRFGGQKNDQEAREKMKAAQVVAIERAQMRARERRKGKAAGFKPIGGGSGAIAKTNTSASSASDKMGGANSKRVLEDTESQDKVTNKKMKLAKFGLKFQSAGTLMSIGDTTIGKDTPLQKEATPAMLDSTKPSDGGTKVMGKGKTFEERKALYTTKKWEKAGQASNIKTGPSEVDGAEKAPPPLMSRQKELTLAKSGDRDSSDDEEAGFSAKTIVKKPPAAFKFKTIKNDYLF